MMKTLEYRIHPFQFPLLMSVLVAASLNGLAQEWAWVTPIKMFYSTAWKKSIAVDSSGNSYYNPGNYEKCIAKYDPQGALIWVHQGYNQDMALDPDGNVLLTGEVQP